MGKKKNTMFCLKFLQWGDQGQNLSPGGDFIKSLNKHNMAAFSTGNLIAFYYVTINSVLNVQYEAAV